MNTINRLQFRHHSEQFETREAALEYIQGVAQGSISDAVSGLASVNRDYGFSLLGEPTILTYKNDEDEKNPHVMLVIGSNTNDSGQYYNNRFCVIDIDMTEGEINDLAERIDEAVKSLAIIATSSNTISMYAEKTDDGTILSGDVRLSEQEILLNEVKDNKLIATDNGLFIYVNLSYDEDTDIITFQVNGEKSEIALDNDYVVSGEYSKEEESIVLNMKKGGQIVIDLEDLLDEWTVLGEASSTPIVLTKETYGYGDSGDTHHHVEPWQDILKADVRVASNAMVPNNILEKTEDGRYLFVDGKASNITYYNNGEKTNVKEVLDELTKIGLSSDSDNIVVERIDGYFASAKLTYDNMKNELTFKTSGQEPAVIQLNSVQLFTSIYYDPVHEELVLKYIDAQQKVQTVTIPIGEMIEEWEPFNDGHSVNIVRTRTVNGKDKVSADVKIRTHEGIDNILEDYNHELYVRGTSDNIKHGTNSTVKQEIDDIHATNAAQEEHLTTIDNTIGSGFTTDAHETITYKFNEEIARAEAAETALDAKIDAEIARAEGAEQTLTDNLDAEVTRSTTADESHEARLDLIEGTIGNDGTFTTDAHETITYKFNELSGKTDAEIGRATAKDDQLQADLDAEVTRSTTKDAELNAKDAELTDTIGSGFTTDAHETVTYKFDALSGKTDALSGKTDNEIARATAKDTELDAKIDQVSDDKTIEVGETESVRLTKAAQTVGSLITADVKTSNNSNNIVSIDANGHGIFASVDLNYDSASDTLTLSRNGFVDKQIQLSGDSFIESIVYDNTTEELVITYKVDGGTTKEVRVPMHDLIDEVDVDSGHTQGAIQLVMIHNHESGASHGPDLIQADIIISEAADNIVEIRDSHLYVSNSAITANKNSIDAIKVSADTLNNAIISERTRAISAETALRTDLNFEVARALSSETRVETALNNEVTRASGAEADLSSRVAVLENGVGSFKVNDTQTIDLTLSSDTTTSAYTLSADVRLANATDNMLVTTPDVGVYATVDVNYEPATNTLTFSRTDRLSNTHTVDKAFILNAGSFIDDISYDKGNHELVIKYSSAGSSQEIEVRVPLDDLLNEWIVVNPTDSPVVLSKVSGASSEELSATLKIATDGDINSKNILQKTSQGSLYVKGTSDNINHGSGTVESYLDNLANDIDDLRSGEGSSQGKIDFVSGYVSNLLSGTGLEQTQGLYPDYVGGCFISAATSLMDADTILDQTLCEVKEAVNNIVVGSETYSSHVYIDQIDNNKRMKVDVRVSHGSPIPSGYQMSDEELIIEDFTGATIEDGVTEFTDTNVLREVNVTHDEHGNPIRPESLCNGIYLSNIWDCGLYTENGVNTPRNKYRIDDNSSAQGFNYNNYNRKPNA